MDLMTFGLSVYILQMLFNNKSFQVAVKYMLSKTKSVYCLCFSPFAKKVSQN